MRKLFRITVAGRRICPGIIAGAYAVLRSFMGNCTINRRSGAGKANLRSSSAPAASFAALLPNPPYTGGLGKTAKNNHFLRVASLAILLILAPATSALAALTVDNIAKASYSVGPVPMETDSNPVSIVVRTPSQIEFLAYAPLAVDAEPVNVAPTSYLAADGSYVALAAPVPLGSITALDLSQPVLLVKTKIYHQNEPLFIRLTDLDQNLDPLTAETVLVTLNISALSETETLLFTETGPDTGIFTGHIQSVLSTAVAGNGQLSVDQDNPILASYTDRVDDTDTSTEAVLVDPFGIVFDTATGLPVNGAVVTLIDAATGFPATVFGDDGVSTYPSSVTTGGTFSDSSGRVYIFRPGFYRFPYLQPGRYILRVIPPPAYRAPSSVSTADIQTLPGAPFAINPGSRGEVFVVNPGPAIHIDIPVDPLTMSLYLTKTASKNTVAIGDFLQYKVTVENTALIDATNVLVNDRLPLGFRFRSGSTRIDNIVAADPSVSADGRTLIFNVGTVEAANTAALSYVVEVAAGARLGQAENRATATGEVAMTSNLARAGVLVKEDLFSRWSTIVGRVFPGGCGEEGQDNEGVAGVRIYLEDGTYVITDKMGMYHFEGVEPGSHVVQLDQETLPEDYRLVSCEENDRFAGNQYSQFADLQGGTMWRADFYTMPVPPVVLNGPVQIELSSLLVRDQADSYALNYTVDINLGEVPTDNLRLTLMLPKGTEYQPGSSFYAGAALPDPDVIANVMTYRLGVGQPHWQGQVSFIATAVPDLSEGEFVTRALLTFDTAEAKNLRTPLADNILAKWVEEERVPYRDITLRPLFPEFGYALGDEDHEILDGIIAELKKVSVTRIFVTGHTNSTRIASRSRHIMADNYALSRARAKSVADYLIAGLELAPEKVVSDGKGPDEPVASNSTYRGRALNRRVEMRVLSERVTRSSEVKNIKERSGSKAIEISAVDVAEKSSAEQAEEARRKSRTIPEFDQAWLQKAKPGLALVWPDPEYHPAIPSVKIAVTHTPGKHLQLLHDGEEVDSLYLDGTTKRTDNAVALSLWVGVHLHDGDNLIEAVESGPDGTVEARVNRVIHYSGPPVKAELAPEFSRLTADGKTPSVIAVRLTDSEGHPAREGVVGECSVDPPYLPLQKLDALQKNPLITSKSQDIKYMVGADGIVRLELQPTSRSGEVTLRFKLVSGEHEVSSWLTPGEREWILVGLAEGTAGYNSIAGNMESLGEAGGEDNYYDDGRLAFFAKGMIRGEWLLTAAYDSDRRGIRENDSLHGTIDPGQYYTLYGDAAAQQYEAASARSLYLKIERDKFYALFGDFATGLSVTELSAYNRNLNGLKVEMKGENHDFNLFASDTNQAFVKDEIRGDGTSGIYLLSRQNIVMNSESITVEARDRFKSEVIVSSRRLSRHLDYDIDYEAGTIFFKSPVFSRDENFNPVYIVVDYESFDSSDLSFNYGGRGAARFLGNKLEIGATHIHEGRAGGEGNLNGIDTTFKLSEQTTVRAELAATDSDFNGVAANGTAYLAELTHRDQTVEAKAYIREQESAFGLGQQMGSETGTRKIGVFGSYKFNEKISFLGDASRQDNLGTDGVRDIAETTARFNEKGYSLHTGLRHAKEKLGNGEVNTSAQLTVGGTYHLLADSLILRAEHDQSLPGSNESSVYPTRTILGADYRLSETAILFVAQEFTFGEFEDTETTRLGLKGSPWEGGQLSSTLERQYNENGARVFAVTGLQQTWQVTEKWSVDAGLDRSDTISHPGNKQFKANVPAASGSSNDFTAVTAGAAYRKEKWSWTGRLELREAENEDKVGIFSGIYGEVDEGIGLSLGLQAFNTQSAVGLDKTNTDLRFGLAYRPELTRWIILDRMDLLIDKQKGAILDFDNWRIINNLNANYRHDQKTQLSLQHAMKYVNDTIDGNDYGGFTDLIGVEGRYDLTKAWDIGLRCSALHSWSADQISYGTGISVGHDLVKNLWLSVGYNFTGFTDRDFSSAEFTAQGPFIKLRMKFDQGSARDAVKMLSGQ